MDTYINIDYSKCQKCGLCIEVCDYLTGRRNKIPISYSDNPGCRVCDEPCKEVCYYGAIDWERY